MTVSHPLPSSSSSLTLPSEIFYTKSHWGLATWAPFLQRRNRDLQTCLFRAYDSLWPLLLYHLLGTLNSLGTNDALKGPAEEIAAASGREAVEEPPGAGRDLQHLSLSRGRKNGVMAHLPEGDIAQGGQI